MNTTMNFSIFMCMLAFFCGIVMKMGEPGRPEISAYFVKILRYCAPQGFAAENNSRHSIILYGLQHHNRRRSGNFTSYQCNANT